MPDYPQFTYAITREIYASTKDKTDCHSCLIDDCNELDTILEKIYSQQTQTHRCPVYSRR